MKNIYLLKDLSRLSGQSTHTIKYYLKIGLLRECGRSPETNFRYFNDETLESIRNIRLMRQNGLSIKEINKRLQTKNQDELL